MASIEVRTRKDGTTAHRVVWREPGDPTKQSLTFDEAEHAKRLKRMLDGCGNRLADAQRIMTAVVTEEPTVDQVCERHIAAISGITARTRADYRRDVRKHITPYLGALPISAPDGERIKRWVNDLDATGMSGKTLRNIHGLLSAVFETAKSVKPPLRDDNPCRGVRLPDYVPTEMVFLEPDEFAILLGHIPAEHQLLIQLKAGTGMRWGEVAALLPEDFAFGQRPSVRVNKAWKRTDTGYEVGTPKTRKSVRTVSLPESLIGPLREHVMAVEARRPVFPNSQGGYLYRPVFGEYVWRPAVRAAQAAHDKFGNPVPEHRRLQKTPRVHDLRHSHASWLIAAGVDLPTVQARLGHESITTTVDRYGHLAADQLNRAAQAADAALGAVNVS